MNTRVRILLKALFFFAAAVYGEALPESFLMFRDMVYAQDTGALQTMWFYAEAKQDLATSLDGDTLYLALSRCEYLMGLSFQMEGKKKEASDFFERGIIYAENSVDLHPSSEGYQLIAANIGLCCGVNPISYALRNAERFEKAVENALALNPQNLVARYLSAAKYVTAPWPVGSPRKGAALLEEIARQDTGFLEKEDLFNLYMMLEAAYLKLGEKTEAGFWHEKALALYPSNNFISVVLQ